MKGYWSSGTRLRDSANVAGDGIEDGEFPEYLVNEYFCYVFAVALILT
jgi:hypothetical protein